MANLIDLNGRDPLRGFMEDPWSQLRPYNCVRGFVAVIQAKTDCKHYGTRRREQILRVAARSASIAVTTTATFSQDGGDCP